MSTIDEILMNSGMPQDVIKSLTEEMKEYIITTSGKEMTYIPLLKETKAGSGNAPISLYAFATKVTSPGSKTQYEIYASYESTEPIKPKGNDAFGMCVDHGMSIVSGTFGGVAYYKMNSSDSWVSDGNLSATEESIYGYGIKGKQLGTPDFAIYLKGGCHFRATLDDEVSAAKKVALAYAYNRSGSVTYTMSLNMGVVSFGVTSGTPSNLQEKSQVFSF